MASFPESDQYRSFSRESVATRPSAPKDELFSPLNFSATCGDEIPIELIVQFAHNPRERASVLLGKPAKASDEAGVPTYLGNCSVGRCYPFRGEFQIEGPAVGCAGNRMSKPLRSSFAIRVESTAFNTCSVWARSVARSCRGLSILMAPNKWTSAMLSL